MHVVGAASAERASLKPIWQSMGDSMVDMQTGDTKIKGPICWCSRWMS